MEYKQPDTVYPGMWRFPKSPEHCCIYRVPHRLRRVNPEAYTPQLVIIGPLHHSLKSQALKSLGDVTKTKSMGYLNMEEHKKIYLAEFTRRVEGRKTIDDFRRIIEEDEEIIRASYSESTAWIESPEFVEMILHDAVFVLEFIMSSNRGSKNTWDPLMDECCLEKTVREDLTLLENQLPYFILEKLFEPILDQTFRQLIITYFRFNEKIKNDSKFRHFTDLARTVRVETLPELTLGELDTINHMYSADKLYSGGIKFEAIKEDFSLHVRFENGCLKIPSLRIEDEVEMTLRNVMAFEQCHHPFKTHVCDYIMFLDYLIDTDKDVDLLAEKGIIQNWLGQPNSVAEMMNKLCLGIIDGGSYYSGIAKKVNDRYSSPIHSSWAVLKQVYFRNLWTGTATVAATLLLVMTLIQTVDSMFRDRIKKKAP